MASHSRGQLRGGPGTSQAVFFPAAKPLRQSVPWRGPRPRAWEGSSDHTGPTGQGAGWTGPPPTWAEGGLCRAWATPPPRAHRWGLLLGPASLQGPQQTPAQLPPPHPPPAPGAKTKAHPGKGAGRPQRGPVPKPGSLGGWGLCVSAAGLLPCPHGLGGICLPEGLYLWLWLGQGGRGGRKMATRAHHLLPEAKSPKPTGLKKTSCPSGRGPGG